jgi:excisionase family DNA binding protein
VSALAVTLTVEELRTLVREAVREEIAGPAKAPLPEVMTRSQVADLLGIEEHTVTKYVKTKGLPGERLAGRGPWRFRRSAVLRWMEEQKR